MDIILEAALLGLSTGIYCLGYCSPALFALFFSEERSSIKVRLELVLKFSSGRLLAYLLFGAIAGYAGQSLSNPVFRKYISLSIIILAVLMIFYGVLNGFSKTKLCSVKKIFPKTALPFSFGFLTGFNVCPPFLLALTYVFSFGEIFKGITFFFIFFIATSLYLIPFIFVGYFSKYEKMRWVAQIATILAGVLFLVVGLSNFFMT